MSRKFVMIFINLLDVVDVGSEDRNVVSDDVVNEKIVDDDSPIQDLSFSDLFFCRRGP
jgi:hypothetical protein